MLKRKRRTSRSCPDLIIDLWSVLPCDIESKAQKSGVASVFPLPGIHVILIAEVRRSYGYIQLGIASLPRQEKLTLSYSHGVSSKPFIGDTIGRKLDKTVDKFPDREAYVFCEDNERATFAQLKDEVNAH